MAGFKTQNHLQSRGSTLYKDSEAALHGAGEKQTPPDTHPPAGCLSALPAPNPLCCHMFFPACSLLQEVLLPSLPHLPAYSPQAWPSLVCLLSLHDLLCFQTSLSLPHCVMKTRVSPSLDWELMELRRQISPSVYSQAQYRAEGWGVCAGRMNE